MTNELAHTHAHKDRQDAGRHGNWAAGDKGRTAERTAIRLPREIHPHVRGITYEDASNFPCERAPRVRHDNAQVVA